MSHYYFRLIQDFHLIDKLGHFDRERIPERVVHAKGAGAHGYFEVTNPDISKWCKAKFLSKVGKRTPLFARFSTVGGEKGSADTERDPRGFALKFYTEHQLQLNAQGASQVADTTVIPENPTTGAQDGAPRRPRPRLRHRLQLRLLSPGRMEDHQGTYAQLRRPLRLSTRAARFGRTSSAPASTPPSSIDPTTTAPWRLRQLLHAAAAGEHSAGHASASSPTPPTPPRPACPTIRSNPSAPTISTSALSTTSRPNIRSASTAIIRSRQNLIDDGQFGAAPILSAFNYRRGQICGVELSQNYTQGGFSAYAQYRGRAGHRRSRSTRRNRSSSAPTITTTSLIHYIYLDHSQTFTGSARRLVPHHARPKRRPIWR